VLRGGEEGIRPVATRSRGALISLFSKSAVTNQSTRESRPPRGNAAGATPRADSPAMSGCIAASGISRVGNSLRKALIVQSQSASFGQSSQPFAAAPGVAPTDRGACRDGRRSVWSNQFFAGGDGILRILLCPARNARRAKPKRTRELLADSNSAETGDTDGA